MQAQWLLQKTYYIIKESNIQIQNSIGYAKRYRQAELVRNLVALIIKLLIFL
jgi:hypothetical protein